MADIFDYLAEESYFTYAWDGDQFTNLGEVQDYVNRFTDSRWFAVRWPTVYRPSVIRRYGSYNCDTWTVRCTLSTDHEADILHQLAHLTLADSRHDPGFARRLLDLFQKKMGPQAMARQRVYFADRRIRVKHAARIPLYDYEMVRHYRSVCDVRRTLGVLDDAVREMMRMVEPEEQRLREGFTTQ